MVSLGEGVICGVFVKGSGEFDFYFFISFRLVYGYCGFLGDFY